MEELLSYRVPPDFRDALEQQEMVLTNWFLIHAIEGHHRLTPGEHIMELYREALEARGVLDSQAVAEKVGDGQKVRVAGRVVVCQRPQTAKGAVSITLEDEVGLVNLVVWPKVYARYRETIRNAALLLVEGHLQREGQAYGVLERFVPVVYLPCWHKECG